MAKVADYSIVVDRWLFEGTESHMPFYVPSNIDKGSRSILGFMLDVWNVDDLRLTVRINGKKVWARKFPDGRRWQFVQEVIASGVVKSGTNKFSFKSSSDDYNSVLLSDVVVWWKANV